MTGLVKAGTEIAAYCPEELLRFSQAAPETKRVRWKCTT